MTQIFSSDIALDAFRLVTETIPSTGGSIRNFNLTYNPIGINALYGHINVSALYAGAGIADFCVGNDGELITTEINNGSYISIRNINISGDTVTTFAGATESGTHPYTAPTFISPSTGLGTTFIQGNGQPIAFDTATDSTYFMSNSQACYRVSGNLAYRVGGDGSISNPGDGFPFTGVGLYSTPEAFFGNGQLYYVDAGQAYIKRVDPSGIVWFVAGDGSIGYNGDEIPATGASFNGSNGIFVDASGVFYFADSNNQRVRMVDSSGIIHTVAGTGTNGYSGDSGPAVDAQLNYPGGVVKDSLGNLYISDSNNFVIRKVDISGIITTVAGNGVSDLTQLAVTGNALSIPISPYKIRIDSSDNIYFTDGGRVIRKFYDGQLTTLFGLGGSTYTEGEYLLAGVYMIDPSDIALFNNKSATTIGSTSNKIIYSNSGTSITAEILATAFNPTFAPQSIDSFKVIYTTNE